MQSIEIKDIWNDLDIAILVISVDGNVILSNNLCKNIFNSKNFFECIENKDNLLKYLKKERKIIGLEVLINLRKYNININPIIKNDKNYYIISIENKSDNFITEKSKNSSIKAISEMLAHEIKNPLSGIKGAAQLLHDDLSEDNKELTNVIEFEITRIQNILDKMEMFSDKVINLEELNIHKVLDHIITLLSVEKSYKINKLYDPSLPKIKANKNLIIQAFLNLLKNAIEATPENGNIIVKTSFDLNAKINSRTNEKMPIIISIIDNGSGVDKTIENDLFDPFITTKPALSSGLGLSITSKIINDHNGVISYERFDNQTVFKVMLPIARILE